ncbi:MAG: response regulator [Deltaproteobacteria bacterium]|nr:response regulator [Deltaproteobacteria bacterium]
MPQKKPENNPFAPADFIPFREHGIERKEMERDLRKLEEEKRLLEEHLRRAQKMEALGTLAGGIAHDFNNILASMMGFTEMAARETRRTVRNEYLDQVLLACGRAKNLVNQILAISRSQEQERRPLDIRILLKEALSLLRASLPSTIEIRSDLASEEMLVLADPTEVHQIIVNLCTNAAHVMQDQGGVLTISLTSLEIPQTARPAHPDLQAGNYVRLSVSDTGRGIDADIKEKIFDPSFTTGKDRGGTGLGLSVVHGIVKNAGGAIDVQSAAGQGATFAIYLPRILPCEKPETADRDGVDLPGSESILFVDDEEMLVRMAKNYFQTMGYQITATASSPEALRLFQENPARFDLVIADMTMPQITGASLCRMFLKIRPELPIILCTGYSDAASMSEIEELNIRELVLKPVFIKDLGLRVRRILDDE